MAYSKGYSQTSLVMRIVGLITGLSRAKDNYQGMSRQQAPRMRRALLLALTNTQTHVTVCER